MMIGDFLNTIDNLGYGFMLAIFIDLALMICIGIVYHRKQFSVWSYVIAALLLIPLSFHMSLLIGACFISPTTAVINDIITNTAPILSKYVCSATREDIGWFIFRRIAWSTLFITGAACLIVYTMKSDTRRRLGYASARGERISSRRSSEHRTCRSGG